MADEKEGASEPPATSAGSTGAVPAGAPNPAPAPPVSPPPPSEPKNLVPVSGHPPPGATPSKPPSGRDPVERIRDRIADADTPQEMVVLTQVSGELLRQDQDRLDREHARSVDTARVRYRMLGGVLTFSCGIGLLATGNALLAPFLLGGALYTFAPGYVESVLDRFRKRGADE